jgi:DNA (cytosine-5)-methyltransferase 1
MGRFEIEIEAYRLDAMIGACKQIILDECERDRNWPLAVASSMCLFARLCAAAGMSDADIRRMLRDYLAIGEHRLDLPAAASVGAPHIRQRCFFGAVRLGDAKRAGLEGHAGHGDDRDKPRRERAHAAGPTAAAGHAGGLADADGRDTSEERQRTGRQQRRQPQDGGAVRGRDRRAQPDPAGGMARPGPSDSFWSDADWLFCRDGKWRPVEPGTFPLADGVSARVVRLRGYGNAIVPQAAAAFVMAFMEAMG